MEIDESKLKPEDFGEPYSSLVYRIGIANTIKFANNFSGRQINFRKNDIKKGKIFNEIAEIFNEVLALEIANIYAGEKIYFPKIKVSCKDKIENLVVEKFDGNNQIKLAKQFECSERHIYKILENKRYKKHLR